MQNLSDLDLKPVYRTGTDDLYNDFYKPVLAVSVNYDRAVGFFSSEILSLSIKGITNLVKSNGTMRLIIGHPLADEEFIAVKHGALLKEYQCDLASKLEAILLAEDRNKRLELLSLLIASNRLQIKFALRRPGMYHEKIGIFRDAEDNKVVFQGSANETPHGMIASLNAESISVYKSWDERTFADYGRPYVEGFERLWDNQEQNIETFDVPSSLYEKIKSSIENEKFTPEYIDDIEVMLEGEEFQKESIDPFIPKAIEGKAFKIFDHQQKALNAWQQSSYKGILELATGSGKTITSIYGAVKIYQAQKNKKGRLCLVIAVPYIELAHQWIENLRRFNIFPHQCFDSKRSWIEAFKSDIESFRTSSVDFIAAVVVNKTLVSDDFSNLLSTVDARSLMFIGDECHNHGSAPIAKRLPEALYKMGLSATPFRSDNDDIDSPFPDEAKERLKAYYGEIVASYTLSDAIYDEVLTPYEYHIIPVYLTAEEQDLFDEFSNKIKNLILRLKAKGLSKEEKLLFTSLCGQRSRLLGSASNKLKQLEEITRNISSEDKKHTLFYAGEGKPFSESGKDDIRVIDQVAGVLNQNGWRVAKFTSEVSRNQRKSLMTSFKGKTLDGLVALKVLDEGIDVPVCDTAYILASTKNPRQYVQRRGRILRKAKGKSIAKIYDFVVLPLNDNSFAKKLRKSEADRVNDFALLATNKLEIEIAIQNLGLTYDQ